MDKATGFLPLTRVSLPVLGDLDCSGLILVVGANSAGKSQFLRDIFERLIGNPRKNVVAERIDVRKPADVEEFIKEMIDEGYFIKSYDENDNEYLRPRTSYVGMSQAAQQIPMHQGKSWYGAYDTYQKARTPKTNEFLSYFGKFLVTALFLDRRLLSLVQVSTFDHYSQPPQNDLHALYLDEGAKRELLGEIRATFSKSLWLDGTRGGVLSFKVSDDPTMPTLDERLDPRAMEKYRTVESEGDGLKSYAATCIALLLGRRPVCLVDEPEMCLHPPQAYSLGRFIGSHATSEVRATFVATHSSHILRGVIQTATKLQIVRLIRKGASFQAHLVSPGTLAKILERPTVRAEAVLDGVFSQAVVILEADGDREVYQAVYESLSSEHRFDIHFAAVGGTGGIADTCRLYRTLRIPIAVVADLDLVLDPDRLQRILKEMASDRVSESLSGRAKTISAKVKALPPTMDPQEVKQRLTNAAGAPMDWSKGADTPLRLELQELAQGLDRMRRIKSGGISGLPTGILEDMTELVSSLAKAGVFVVPKGELEGWLSHLNISASKRNKWAWANEAAASVRKLGPQPGDVWDFIREVAQHLSIQLT